MTLQEAFEKAGDDDLLVCDLGDCAVANKKSELINSDIPCEVAVSKTWKVIPAEPKVLTYDKWVIKNHTNQNDWEIGYIRIAFEAGHQNGRLERDLEVRPVIEKVERCMQLPSCNDFSMVMNNLKPLNKEQI